MNPARGHLPGWACHMCRHLSPRHKACDKGGKERSRRRRPPPFLWQRSYLAHGRALHNSSAPGRTDGNKMGKGEGKLKIFIRPRAADSNGEMCQGRKEEGSILCQVVLGRGTVVEHETKGKHCFAQKLGIREEKEILLLPLRIGWRRLSACRLISAKLQLL